MAIRYDPAQSVRTLLMVSSPLTLNSAGSAPTSLSSRVSPASAPFEIGTLATGATQPVFVDPDASVQLMSMYDEMILDPQPQVNALGVVSTAFCADTYRLARQSGTMLWFMVRMDGYGTPLGATASGCLQVAYNVMAALWADAQAYMLTPQLVGFAFMNPDLNIVFTADGSLFTRADQSALVQSCWSLNKRCTLITTRPEDVLGLIGPVFPLVQGNPNPNSNLPLPNPIIGCSPAQQDRLVILYPSSQDSGHSMSTIVGQLSATLAPTNRDPGFTPNMDVAYVVPTPAYAWTPDGVIGVNPVLPQSTEFLTNMATFLATAGITTIGLQAGQTVPTPDSFLPSSSYVNTSGSCRIWSSRGVVSVEYPVATGGSAISTFDFNFNRRSYDLVSKG